MPGVGQPAHLIQLHLAMVQGAVYDAVNAIDGGHQPYLVAPAADPSDSKDAAAATAAYESWSDSSALFPMLPQAVRGWLTRSTTHRWRRSRTARRRRRDRGRRGRRRGDARRAGRTTGASARSPSSRAPTLASGGRRRPTFARDPAPWVGNVKPFLVPNVEMLRTDGPNALTSAAYAEDFNEVKELGSLTSTTRTADQTRRRDLLAGQRPRSGTASSARWRRARSWTSPTAPACSR